MLYGGYMKKRDTLFEFLRYAVVGGVAAVVDMAVNYLMLYHVFSAGKDDKTYVAISVAVGFIAGLIVNFILSNIFVFKSEEQRARGKTAGAFFIYVAVGVVGFGITELLTLLGTRFIGDHALLCCQRHRADMELCRTQALCLPRQVKDFT